MRISFVSEYDSSDIHNWSGLGYNISKALENQQAQIHYIGNLKSSFNFIDIAKKVYYKVQRKRYLDSRTISGAKSLAKRADRLLTDSTDIVFSPGSLPVAYMNNNYPKVFYTDATFAGMLNFYPGYFNLSKESIRIGHYLEQRALDNCVLAIYSSEWAANSALKNYRVDQEKIQVIPFGANLSRKKSSSEIVRIVEERSKSVCKLLFIGVDWQRKGGDVALSIAEKLNNLGILTELHVVGIRNLPLPNIPPFVKNYGFLTKSNEENLIKIEELLSESHFLIVPSVAEAYGLVFCEASAFGLPSLASNVGGIGSAIRDGVNGATFPLNCNVMEYVRFIENCFNNHSRYERLAYSSYEEFQSRLNWDVAGKNIMNILKKVSTKA